MFEQENEVQEEPQMAFGEKNVMVSLVISSLILIYYLVRVLDLIQTDNFLPENIFRLWGAMIVMVVVGIIVATIVTHIIAGIAQAIRTGREPEIEGVEDERDKLIELKGTRIAYGVSSLGVFLVMLTFVFNRDSLVMFSMLILVGQVATIVGDISRLVLYRRGF